MNFKLKVYGRINIIFLDDSTAVTGLTKHRITEQAEIHTLYN